MSSSIMSPAIRSFLQHQTTPIAFVLSCGTNGLGVIRSLGAHKIPVIGVDYADKPGFHSHFCYKLLCPNPLEDEGEFVRFLCSIGEELPDRGVLLPAADYYVFAISKHIDILKEFYHIPLSDYQITEQIGCKKIFYQNLKKFGIDHPSTHIIREPSDLSRVSGEVSYPCIIKPSFSSGFARQFDQKLFLVSSRRELMEKFELVKSMGHEPVIQEWIPGGDEQLVSVMGYLDREGEPRGVFTLRKLRQFPDSMGSGSLVISERIPDAVRIALGYLRKIGYHGLFGAELKWDMRDCAYKFIEINARLNLQNILATRCGLNLPYIAYMDATGGQSPPVLPQIEGIKWLYFIPDIRRSIHLILEGKLTISGWLGSYQGRMQCAIFSLNDPVPFLFHIRDEIEMTLRGILQKDRNIPTI